MTELACRNSSAFRHCKAPVGRPSQVNQCECGRPNEKVWCSFPEQANRGDLDATNQSRVQGEKRAAGANSDRDAEMGMDGEERHLVSAIA